MIKSLHPLVQIYEIQRIKPELFLKKHCVYERSMWFKCLLFKAHLYMHTITNSLKDKGYNEEKEHS